MPIKYILLAIILLIIIRVTSKLRSRELGIREYLLWVIFWLGAGLVIIYPETANFVANLVGVGRGADVMVYTSIIAIFYFVFRILVRQEKMEKNITKVIRHIAIKDEEAKTKNQEKNIN